MKALVKALVMVQRTIGWERIHIIDHDHLAAQGNSPGHAVRIQGDHAGLPGRRDTVVLGQRKVQIALLRLVLLDQVERARISRH